MDLARLSAKRAQRSFRQHDLWARLALRLQPPRLHHRHASHRDSGARDSRVGRNQQHHGAHQDRRDSVIHHIRVALHTHTPNWHPFSPNGWPGILTGGSIVFFTYIGFDSVSTAAEECRSPQRDLPRGIIATLVVCTLLYIGVVVVLTGLVRWDTLLDDAAPVVNTLKKLDIRGLRLVVLIGALMGMISSLLVFQIGQARVWFAMSRDGLFPRIFSRVHRSYLTPDFSTWVAGFVVGIPAGLLDIGTFADLSNIGTLFAFALVAAGVLILRYREPDRHRAFRAPGGPLAPVLTILTCVLLMAGLPIMNWIRFFVWLALGLVIYFTYSRKRSTLQLETTK